MSLGNTNHAYRCHWSLVVYFCVTGFSRFIVYKSLVNLYFCFSFLRILEVSERNVGFLYVSGSDFVFICLFIFTRTFDFQLQGFKGSIQYFFSLSRALYILKLSEVTWAVSWLLVVAGLFVFVFIVLEVFDSQLMTAFTITSMVYSRFLSLSASLMIV